MSITIPELPDADYEVALERWTQDVRALLPGVAIPLIQAELLHTVREFFRKAQPWLQELGPYTLEADQREMKLNPVPDGETITVIVNEEPIEIPIQQVLYVKRVMFKGFDLSPRIAGGSRSLTTGTTPGQYYLPYPDVIRFVPIPTLEHVDSITVWAVMGPKDPAEYMPQMVWTHFYDIILDGLLGRLYMHPQKPYSNKEMGLYRSRQFSGKCLTVKAAAERAYTNTSSRTAFPRFGV